MVTTQLAATLATLAGADPASRQGVSLLGLALVFVIGVGLLCLGQAIRHSRRFYDLLVQHVETQRRLRRQPPLPRQRYERDRRPVSAGLQALGSLVLVLGLVPMIGDLLRP